MRHLRLFPTIIVATAFVMCGALAPQQALTQSKKEAQKKEAPKKEAPGKKDAAPKVGPYKPVAIQLPATTTDASFDAFRKQLTGIAQKKDRAALAGLVAASFFSFPDEDSADKAKPGIDNLSTAIGLAREDRNRLGGARRLRGRADQHARSPAPRRDLCAHPGDLRRQGGRGIRQSDAKHGRRLGVSNP